jgi:hypothetical protein
MFGSSIAISREICRSQNADDATDNESDGERRSQNGPGPPETWPAGEEQTGSTVAPDDAAGRSQSHHSSADPKEPNLRGVKGDRKVDTHVPHRRIQVHN